MIQVRVVLDDASNIVELVSQGHSVAEGLCPSLSTLQYTFWYSAKSLSGAVCDLSTGDGVFRYTCSQSDGQKNSLYENLCSFFLVGIQVLQTEFATRAKGELCVSVVKK